MEKAMVPHSSTVARKIPWMEEPGRLQSMGSLRVRHDWATWLSLSTFMHWRRKWQPTPVFLPGESHGRRSLAGYSPWGLKSQTRLSDFQFTNQFKFVKVKVLVAQSSPTLCDPIDCGLQGFSVRGILQARMLEWVAIPFSRGSSWLRNWTWVSCIAGRFITVWATRKSPNLSFSSVQFSRSVVSDSLRAHEL